MAGDSGGVFGSAVAVGDGGALTLDKNRARRSTRKRLAQDRKKGLRCSLCLLLWAFMASSFRRLGTFFVPAFFSFVDARSASKRAGSRPFSVDEVSVGRKGEGCL